MRFEIPFFLLGLALSASAQPYVDQYTDENCKGNKLNGDNFDLDYNPKPCTQIGPLSSVEVNTSDQLKVNLYYNSNCGGRPDDVVDTSRTVCRGGHYKAYEIVAA